MTYLLIVQHTVEDYDRFAAVFAAHPPSHGGATFHSVNRGVDDPRDVTIIAGFPTTEQAVAWRDAPELRSAVADAGVVGEVRAGVFEEVDASGGRT